MQGEVGLTLHVQQRPSPEYRLAFPEDQELQQSSMLAAVEQYGARGGGYGSMQQQALIRRGMSRGASVAAFGELSMPSAQRLGEHIRLIIAQHLLRR